MKVLIQVSYICIYAIYMSIEKKRKRKKEKKKKEKSQKGPRNREAKRKDSTYWHFFYY